MNIKQIITASVVSSVIVVVIGFFAFLLFKPSTSQGSAPSGLESIVATSSPFTMTAAAGNLGLTLFSTSTNCASRIITTGSTSIFFTLFDVATTSVTGTSGLSGPYGHEQAASTTVVYDSGLYGCGRWKVKANSAGSIYITETR